ncbi:MAG: hypothetical protein IKV91_04945 [Bacteroidales bacterium]|nr:hypothetical protein [Bacteroidales bacterium]
MNKSLQYISSAVFGVAVFLYWILLHPYALGLQEQNQLFLFTSDYFLERIVIAGGLADYISEFITQFNFLPYLGEILMAVIFVVFQRSIAKAVGRDDLYAFSFIAPVMMLIYMGDIYVLLSYLVALIISVQLCICYCKWKGFVWTAIATVLGYWLIGPAVFVFTFFVCIKEKNIRSMILIALALLAIVISKLTYLHQYPWKTVVFGVNYYRKAVTVPAMQLVIACFILMIPVLADYLPRLKKVAGILIYVAVFVVGALTLHLTYKKDIVEIVAYDQLVRHEDWDGILKRAEKYQPDSDLASVSINLALFMSGRGADFPEFKQFGTTGLIQPRVRDFISNSSSCEVFWRLGMINESLRYAFDTQESLVNNRKSGRWTSRMAECQILNGRHDVAQKYLDILDHSLFHRKWADEHRKYLRNDEEIASDNVYAYLRSVRYKEDFLFFYPEMDKMLAKLYYENNNNYLAAWYYKAWTALKPLNANDEETFTGNSHAN